jgi:biopolymer transport protein TolQ
MNPPDVVVDLSIFELFKNAHIVVKLVIIGLLLASIWSWAIILEKLFLYAKMRKETDKFEQVFWSGQSLEELYNALSQRRNTGMAALFVAAMREWKRSTTEREGERGARQMPGVQLRVEKVMDVTISREIERLEGRLDRALRRPVRHGVGHHDELPGDRRQQEHQPRRGRARYRGSLVRDRARPARRHTRRHFLQ